MSDFKHVNLNLHDDFADFFGEELEYRNPMEILGFGQDISVLAENLNKLKSIIKEKYDIDEDDDSIDVHLDDSIRDEQTLNFTFWGKLKVN